jgi:deoxycytidine triphosphate deaminase
MAIFSDIDLQQAKDVDFVITPWNSELVTPVGYDLTIGVAATINGSRLELSFTGKENRGVQISVPAHGKLLILSKESVWLSERIIGTLHARGSLSAKGLLINSTTVDPNWNGPMTFLLHNVSDSEILVDSDKPFVTLILHCAVSQTSTVYQSDPFDSICERYKQYDCENQLSQFVQYARAQQKADTSAFNNLVLSAKTRSPLSRWMKRRSEAIKDLSRRRAVLLAFGLILAGVIAGIQQGLKVIKFIADAFQKLSAP